MLNAIRNRTFLCRNSKRWFQCKESRKQHINRFDAMTIFFLSVLLFFYILLVLFFLTFHRRNEDKTTTSSKWLMRRMSLLFAIQQVFRRLSSVRSCTKINVPRFSIAVRRLKDEKKTMLLCATLIGPCSKFAITKWVNWWFIHDPQGSDCPSSFSLRSLYVKNIGKPIPGASFARPSPSFLIFFFFSFYYVCFILPLHRGP